jgi:hypothetical protein
MNIDVFDNRSNHPRVIGNVLVTSLVTSDDGTVHICLTLHTGFDVLIEVETIKKLSRLVGQADKQEYVRKQTQKEIEE